MGSYNFPLQTISRSATLAVAPYRIVRDGASDGLVVQASAATQRVVGVSDSRGIEAGKSGSVEYAGIVPVEYGDDVSVGDPLTPDADGKAVPATAGQRIIGYACESGGENTIGSVNISLGYVEPTPGEMQVATLAVTHDDLTDEDGAQTIPFAAALPAGAVVLGREIRVTEGFNNAGASATVTADLGVNGGDIDAIVDGAALGTIANISGPNGVRSQGVFGAVTPALTVLASVDVDTLTTGELEVDIYYFVPPS